MKKKIRGKLGPCVGQSAEQVCCSLDISKTQFSIVPQARYFPRGLLCTGLSKRVQSSLARGVNQENPRNQVTVTGIPEKVDKFPEGTVLGLI